MTHNIAFLSTKYPVYLNPNRLLEKLAFSLKVAASEQILVVLYDILIEWHGGPISQTGESYRFLIEQWLQSEVASPAVIEHQDQVSCIGQHKAGAEGTMGLCSKVG